MLMALDHARDMFHDSGYAYDPLDASHTSIAVYLTRLATHLCAPTFVLLAGVSSWLQRGRGKSTRDLSAFLLQRGVWMIVLEATIVSFGWDFSMPYLILFQVIWGIGVAMIVLSGLVWLPQPLVCGIGVAIVAGHNLLDHVPVAAGSRLGVFWSIVHVGGQWPAGKSPVLIMTYPVLAWTGVIALGYGLGPVFVSAWRRRFFLIAGPVLLMSFVLLRWHNDYGDPNPWVAGPSLKVTLMHFFFVQKYPPSLMYLCLTLGFTFLLAALFDSWQARITQFFREFGRVPLFAYVLHLYLLHAADVMALFVTGRSVAASLGQNRKSFFAPEQLAGSGFPLPVVYAVWLGIVLLLYPLCRYWSDMKARNRSWWMSYL